MTSTPPPFDPGRPGDSGAPYSFAKPEAPSYGTPPPPPPGAAAPTVVKAPPIAWLVPLAGLLALVGAFIPWFKAKATLSGNGQTLHHTFDGLYSWKDGKIGLLAPIVLVVLAVVVIGLLQGKQIGRFGRSDSPVKTVGIASAIAGGVTIVCVVIAWFMVTTQYKFKDGGNTYSWDGYIKLAKTLGVDMKLSRGPQLGYWLTVVAGVLAIAGGLAMFLVGRRQETAAKAAQAQGSPYPPAPYGTQPATGQPQSYWQQQGEYGQQSQYGQHGQQGQQGRYGQPGQQ